MFRTMLATRLSMLISMMFGRLNKGKKRTKVTKFLYILLGIYVVGTLMFAFGSMFASMAETLPALELSWLYFAMVAIMGFALGFIGSIL